MSKEFCLHVEGDFACFTRPEMKVERVSYDVITPSAARAIFDAIFWKPGIFWQITRIEVLKPIKWMNLRRNELKGIRVSKQSSPKYIEDNRQQRAGLFLRDVAYRLHGCLKASQECSGENYRKSVEMFTRRARKGQCFNQPYLGTREFSCSFRLMEESAPEKTIEETRDLGWMLYDMDFPDPKNPNKADPRFFHAKMENGTIKLPQWHSQEIRPSSESTPWERVWK